MSLSKSKYWYSNNCLHFLKCAAPFAFKADFLACTPIKQYKVMEWVQNPTHTLNLWGHQSQNIETKHGATL